MNIIHPSILMVKCLRSNILTMIIIILSMWKVRIPYGIRSLLWTPSISLAKCWCVLVGCREDVTFQCYDGTCIPRDHLCDYTIDCVGLLHEDEMMDCVNEAQLTSCKDWRLRGHNNNGIYTISIDGTGTFYQLFLWTHSKYWHIPWKSYNTIRLEDTLKVGRPSDCWPTLITMMTMIIRCSRTNYATGDNSYFDFHNSW